VRSAGVAGRSHERFHPVHLEAHVPAMPKANEAVEVLVDFTRVAEGRPVDVREYDTFAAHCVKSLRKSLGHNIGLKGVVGRGSGSFVQGHLDSLHKSIQ
jgi:hypothetical protein